MISAKANLVHSEILTSTAYPLDSTYTEVLAEFEVSPTLLEGPNQSSLVFARQSWASSLAIP